MKIFVLLVIVINAILIVRFVLAIARFNRGLPVMADLNDDEDTFGVGTHKTIAISNPMFVNHDWDQD